MRLIHLETSRTHQHLVPFLLALTLFLCGFNTRADSPASEATNLELIVRQLDAIDRLVRTSETLPTADNARYFFDYSRLTAEVELIRQGIKAYQTPSRAHPRMPPDLTGHYTRQRASAQ